MANCHDSRRHTRPRGGTTALLLALTALLATSVPSASGFGLSSIKISGGGVHIAAQGTLVGGRFARLSDGVARCRTEQLRRGRRVITCKVAPPRKYGSGDWLVNMQNLPKSRLLYNIRQHLAFNTFFALLVSLAHALTPQHIIDDLHVSPIPHSIMSGALGLLLVFRTNAAYNRFWEARKIWGSVVNICRSLTRLGAVSLGADSEEWGEMKEYLKMFPFLLKQHLQNERNDGELAFSTLPPERVFAVQEDPNPPLSACQIMSEIVARAYAEGGTGQSAGGRVLDFTSVTYRMEMEHCLSSLIDCLGMCERILTTPVPRGYSRHTSRFLTVYGLTLPLVLVPHTELFTAPVVGAVCWGLFSIEEIAYFIEQPFDPEYRQLDLGAYSEKIRGDIERMTVKSAVRDKKRTFPALTSSSQQQPWAIANAPPTTSSVLHLHDDDVQYHHDYEINRSGAAAKAKIKPALFADVGGPNSKTIGSNSIRQKSGLPVNGANSRTSSRSGDQDKEGMAIGAGGMKEGTGRLGPRGDYSKAWRDRQRQKRGWQGGPEDDIIGP